MKKYYLKCSQCGDIAFTFKNKPYDGLKITKNLIVEDIVGGSIIKCISCGGIVLTKNLTVKYLGEK